MVADNYYMVFIWNYIIITLQLENFLLSVTAFLSEFKVLKQILFINNSDAYFDLTDHLKSSHVVKNINYRGGIDTGWCSL